MQSPPPAPEFTTASQEWAAGEIRPLKEKIAGLSAQQRPPPSQAGKELDPEDVRQLTREDPGRLPPGRGQDAEHLEGAALGRRAGLQRREERRTGPINGVIGLINSAIRKLNGINVSAPRSPSSVEVEFNAMWE